MELSGRAEVGAFVFEVNTPDNAWTYPTITISDINGARVLNFRLTDLEIEIEMGIPIRIVNILS